MPPSVIFLCSWKKNCYLVSLQSTKSCLSFFFSKIEVKEHVLRPKGLGLGANKMANVGQQPVKNSGEEELLFKKGAYAKITAGHHKSSYCQVNFFKILFF